MKARRGQTMIEYVLAFAALLVVCSILWRLVSVSARYAIRAENLVSSDYP